MILIRFIEYIDNQGMDLRQLEYFVTVAEERSFTRAASALHVVQSTVSAGVQALERDVGATLIVRTTRTLHLSPAGEELLRRGRELLAAERAALAAVRSSDGIIGGRLRLGAPAAELPFDLPELLGRYRRRFPEVQLRLSTSPSGSAGLRQDVLDDRLDAAFSSVSAPHPALVSTEVASATVVLVVPVGHPLAGAGPVPLPRIADEAFIDFPEGFGQRAVSDEAFLTAGARRTVTTETTTAAMVIAFVRHGLGVALLPRTAALGQAGVVVVPLAPPIPSWRISLTLPAQRWRPPALGALLALIDADRDVRGRAPTTPSHDSGGPARSL